MKLTDLDPHWATTTEGRTGMGIVFLCPHCREQHLAVWFANPTDGGEPAAEGIDPKPRWHRTGKTFDALTLAPSVDASKAGHWHGEIKNGEIK